MSVSTIDFGPFGAELASEIPGTLEPVVRKRIFDWFLALHGGTATDEADQAAEGFSLLGSSGSVPVPWTDASAGPIDAATLMGRVSRSSEVDDIHLASCTTPGSVVIPAVLAAAGLDPEITAERFVAAVAVGYEVVTRLGVAIDGPAALYRGVWPSLAAASVGAAAAVARVLGGEGDIIARALCAGGEMSVLARPRHSRDRFLSFGCGIGNGMMAGVSAVTGGAASPIARWTWLGHLDGDFDAGIFSAEGAERWSGVRAAAVKPFCVGGQGAQVVGTALAHRHEISDPEEIASIEAFVPGQVLDMVSGGADGRPGSIADGVALALVDPESLWNCARRGGASAPGVTALAERVRVIEDARLSTTFPCSWGGRLIVRRTDGSTLEWDDRTPVLDAANSWEQLAGKAAHLLHDLPPGSSEKLEQLCQSFSSVFELLEGSQMLLGQRHIDDSAARKVRS